MNCDEARTLLDARFDHELDPATDLQVSEHLRGCAGCREINHRLTAFTEGVRESLPRYSLPAGLEDRVVSAVRAQSAGNDIPARSSILAEKPRWRPSLQGAALVVGVFLLGAIFGNGIGRRHAVADGPGQSTPAQSNITALDNELLSSHVRSLMASHLYDVASTNQHTVKPWFAGKLDFSPPVVNLAEQGFPLSGGRLDYIAGHPVAALVYRRGQHWINLFVWPASEQEKQKGQQHFERGYTILRWARKGMAWSAVSDVNPVELQEFARLMQKTQAPSPEVSPAASGQ